MVSAGGPLPQAPAEWPAVSSDLLQLGSAEDLSNLDREIGKGEQRQPITPMVVRYASILPVPRFAEHLHGFGIKIDQPGLRDTGADVHRDLDATVVVERAMRHFDHEQHILRA